MEGRGSSLGSRLTCSHFKAKRTTKTSSLPYSPKSPNLNAWFLYVKYYRTVVVSARVRVRVRVSVSVSV